MKKIAIALVLVSFCVLLTACGGKNPMETAIENMVEEELDIDITKNGNSVTIQGEDGTVKYSQDGDTSEVITEDGKVSAGGNLRWPLEYMGDIPELKGNITVVYTGDEGSTVAYEGITLDQAKVYADKLKFLGYKGMNMVDEDGIYVTGENEAGDIVNFVFNANGEATVAYTPVQS